jgi:Domain of unknown function (DUF4160)
MPFYEFIDGIKICIFSNDHVPHHIHANIGEFEALIDIKKIEVNVGMLPKTQLKKTLEFVKINQIELLNAF